MAKDERTRRHELEILRGQLKNERASFLSHWRDLGDHIRPRRPRFDTSDTNRGDKRNQKIIDSTATMSSRTLRSGMMSGVTSPARPWFRLTTPNQGLSEFGPVKEWLFTVQERISSVFLKSNLYNVLPIIYGDMGDFGTAALYMEEALDGDVVRFYAQPIGSYYIANDQNLRVRTFFREFRMTVSQIVDKFGRRDDNSINWDDISTHTRNLYEQNQSEAWIDVGHVIMPNPEFDPNKLDSKYKRFISKYYEFGSLSGTGQQNLSFQQEDKFLRERGYDFFPVLAPRWEVTGEDVYGTSCPGMEGLGDIRQLQLGEKRSMQAIEKMINPPMQGPTSLRNTRSSILPGDITYVDSRDGQSGFRPSHEVRFAIQELEGKQAQIRERIRKVYFEDLFLLLSQSDRRQITATEIDARREEKLLALGPVLERLNQDLLDPLIDNTFEIMLRQGLVPDPPEELQGQDLKVEYISIMAQAQKLAGLSGIERFAGFIAQIANLAPGIVDKLDSDQLADVYGDITSVPPGIVRGDDEVEQIRQQRAQAQAQAQQQEQMAQAAAGAKSLSETKLEDDSALKRLVDQSQAGSLV